MKVILRSLGYLVVLAFALGLVSVGAVGLWRLATGLNAQLAVGLATLVGTVVLAIWNFNKTKEKESEARLFPQRAEVYGDVLDVLKEMVAPEEVVGRRPRESQVTKRLLDAKFKMIVWGSQKTLRAFDYIASQNGDAGDSFARVANLFGCMRRDLGHRVTREDCVSMMLYLLRSEDQAMARSAILETGFYKDVIVRDFPSAN